MRLRTGLGVLAGGVLLLALAGCAGLARWAEDIGNPRVNGPPYTVDAASAALHRSLHVADLHGDTLLLSRDMREASERGHIDLPRLREGRVGLQVFPAVTNMSPCLRREYCAREPNLVAMLVAAQGWPASTWFSDKARALYQAERMRVVAADARAGVALLETREQLASLLAEPPASRRIGAVLGVEGAQAVGDDLPGVDDLAAAGVRVLGLAHYFDNAVAGSAHGERQYGLTDFGRRVIARAVERGMIVDLAHASDQAMMDFLRDFPGAPFMLSHTGIRTRDCPVHRNLSEAFVRTIAAADGLVGIGVWSDVLCMSRHTSATDYANAVADAIVTAVRMIDTGTPRRGDEHVALGSDFDGWVSVGFDARGWPLVTQALRRQGMTEDQIRRVMGGNVCRLLLRGLPGADPPPSPALCD